MVMLTHISRKGLVDGRSFRLVIKRQPKFHNYPGICVEVKMSCLDASIVTDNMKNIQWYFFMSSRQIFH